MGLLLAATAEVGIIWSTLRRYCIMGHDVKNQAWKPPWVVELQSRLRGRNLLEQMSPEKWFTVLMHALAPGTHDSPRYQLVLEKRQGSDPMEFVRPRAVRAVSGHSGINILDQRGLQLKYRREFWRTSREFSTSRRWTICQVSFDMGFGQEGDMNFRDRMCMSWHFSRWIQEMSIFKANNVKSFASKGTKPSQI